MTSAHLSQKLQSVGAHSLGVAHDLNNLFTGMLTFTNVLRHQLKDADQQASLHSIEEGLRRASDLTHSLFALMNDQNESYSIDPVRYITNLMKTIQGGLDSSMTCRLELPRKNCLVKMAPAHLTQILLNLVMNARDAIEGSGVIELKMNSGVSLGKSLFFELIVKDDGMGMSDEVKNQIFQPFFTTKRKGKGMGLGLAIVKSIVDRAGGSIRLESEVGKGSSFIVLIPMTA